MKTSDGRTIRIERWKPWNRVNVGMVRVRFTIRTNERYSRLDISIRDTAAAQVAIGDIIRGRFTEQESMTILTEATQAA